MIRLAYIKERIVQTFWTVFYFFWFLIKGNPGWKCETIETPVQTNCCVSSQNNAQSDNFSNHNHHNHHNHHHNNHNNNNNNSQQQQSAYSSSYRSSSSWKSVTPGQSGFFSRLYYRASDAIQTIWFYGKRIVRWSWHQICKIGRLLAAVWKWLMSIFGQPLPTKTLPSGTTKPFVADSNVDSTITSYNKVIFNPIASEMDYIDDQQLINDDHHQGVGQVPATAQDSESFYTERVFVPSTNNVDQLDPAENDYREMSVPPPAPPPPPPKPIRIATSVEREAKDTKTPTKEFKEVKGGVASFPADVMAELSGTQRMRQERGQSAQREMTQSCHPDMAEWKNQERRDRAVTPHSYRASSVGPTMRRLEQVVSRLEDTNDNEAQFVFRPKQSEINEDGYRMGRSVFSPVEEVEQMRDIINKRAPAYDSRPVTPACSLKSYGGEAFQDTYGTSAPSYRANTVFNETPSSMYHSSRDPIKTNNYNPYSQSETEVRQRFRSVGPPSQNSAGRTTPFQPSVAYSSMPFTSHTSRRSKTPTAAFDRGSNFAYDRDSVTQGTVSTTVRQWPPISNATGAPVEKDSWFSSFAEDTNDDGLITTMARRVVERKVEDNWKWRDEAGQLVDEQNQRSWKGELDTVLRDGPGQGRHWSRTVEMLPTGDTRFQDVSRQYDRNFVVESVIRNY